VLVILEVFHEALDSPTEIHFRTTQAQYKIS